MRDNSPPPLAYLWLVLAATVMMAPLAWMVLTSLKSPEQVAAQPYSWWPQPFRWQNYAEAVRVIPFVRYFMNSVFLCAGSVLGTLVSASMVAYGMARLHWPGRKVAFGLLIATMLLPWQVTMVPRFLIIRELGLYDSLWAIILPKFAGEAFYIFLLRQFFLTIPQEMIDAARIDGSSELGILVRIVVPLSLPALVTVGLLEFIATWNDYGGPLLYLNDPERFPLAYGLEQFVSAHSSETHLLLAAATLFTLPMVLLFLLAQRTFLRGIATTGIKG